MASILPNKLATYLPAEYLPNLPMIYADITTQSSYPTGSPTRLATQHAYGDAQKGSLIAATTVLALGVVSVLMWLDIKVIGNKQTKGTVVWIFWSS